MHPRVRTNTTLLPTQLGLPCGPLTLKIDFLFKIRSQYLSEGAEGWFIGFDRMVWSFRCPDGPLGPFLGPPGVSGLECGCVGGVCPRAPPASMEIAISVGEGRGLVHTNHCVRVVISVPGYL
jgi:hypothetical protein